jgi:hypothetical protein
MPRVLLPCCFFTDAFTAEYIAHLLIAMLHCVAGSICAVTELLACGE